MKKCQFILLSVLLLLAQFSYCAPNVKSIPDKQFVLGLDIGIAKMSQVESVTFPLGYSTFNYVPNQKKPSTTRYGISYGRQLMLNTLDSLFIGLSYHLFNLRDVNGILNQGIFSPLYSANYQYTIRLSQLLAQVKLQHQWHNLFPYVTAGLGSGFNTAKHFNTDVPDYLTVTPSFTNHTNSSFSYALGIGIDTLLLPNITVGVGYLFSDLGQVGLGKGFIFEKTLPDYLNQSHLFSNTILVQLSWYFN